MTKIYPELEGNVAIITGASRGIGRSIALRFSQAGMKLVLNHHSDTASMQQVEIECKKYGVPVVILKADLGKPGTAENIRDLTLDHFGQIDVLVNNAGVSFENPLGWLQDPEIELMISTNIVGLIRATRAVLRAMLPKRKGVILNLSSVLASKPSPGNAVYAGTKGFVETFTRSMAVELGRKNIRINAISPGVIDTDMSSQVRKLAVADVLSKISLGRVGTPSEVAEAAVFLASEHAAYISGCILSVDGAYA